MKRRRFDEVEDHLLVRWGKEEVLGYERGWRTG